MTTQSAAISSVLSLDARRDYTVSITFRTADRIGLTEIVFDPEPLDNGLLLNLIDEVIARAVAWRRDFIDEEAADVAPIPFRMPLYALDR